MAIALMVLREMRQEIILRMDPWIKRLAKKVIENEVVIIEVFEIEGVEIEVDEKEVVEIEVVKIEVVEMELPADDDTHVVGSGDRIVSINGNLIGGKTHTEVVELIQAW
eukprot:gene14172-5176_t